jgi:hypothetical protein
VATVIREVFMERGWKRRLGFFAAAAVLAGGLWAASASGALAAGNGSPWPSTAVPAGSDFCENIQNATSMADIQQLLASGPAEIKPDLHKIFDPVLVAGGVLSPDQADHPADMAQILELSQHYLAYFQSHCPEFQP